jgi:hypothetical protein
MSSIVKDKKEKKDKKDKKEKKDKKPAEPPPPPPPPVPESSSDDSSSSDASGEEDVTPTKASNAGKEADKVNLTPSPEQPGYRAWLATQRSEVVSASGCPSKAYTWMMACNDDTVTDKQLESSSFRSSGHDFENLDAKLSASGFKIAKGLLGMELNRRGEQYSKEKGKLIPGRLVFRILCEPFNLDKERGLQ